MNSNFRLAFQLKVYGPSLPLKKYSMQRYEVLSNLTLAVGSLQIFIPLIQNTVYMVNN